VTWVLEGKKSAGEYRRGWILGIWNILRVIEAGMHTVLRCFSLLWKYTWENQHKGGRISFGLKFQGFQSIVSWLHCYGGVRQNITVMGACSRGGCLLLMPRKQKVRKGDISPSRHTPTNLLLPTKSHLLLTHLGVNSSMELSIDEVSVLMIQSLLIGTCN
jgi:hypothetical protein